MNQSPDGGVVLTPGSSQTLYCQVTPQDGDTTVSYRWTRDGGFYSNTDSINLTATSQTSNINGLYTCTALLRVTSISEADPAEWQVGSAVVTVGGMVTITTLHTVI